MGRTAYNLVLALVNATLILVVLCLWLSWNVLSSVRGITRDVAAASQQLTGVSDDVEQLTGEVAALRTELAQLQEGAADASGARLEAVEARLAEIGQKLAWAETLRDGFTADVVGGAVEASVERIGGMVGRLAGCVAADATPVEGS